MPDWLLWNLKSDLCGADMTDIKASHIQGMLNKDLGKAFNERLSGQVESCARKVLERLQQDLLGPQALNSAAILQLSEAAEILLSLRDKYK